MGKVKDFYHDEIVFQQKLKKIRKAFQDYVSSEGCSCCRQEPEHKEAANKLGELLEFQRFDDGSGYDFYDGQYTTNIED